MEKYNEAMMVVENESRPLHSLVVNLLPKVNDSDREYAIAWVKKECLDMGVEIGTDSSRDLMNSMYFNKIAKLQLWRFITSLDNEQADNFLNTVKHLQGESE